MTIDRYLDKDLVLFLQARDRDAAIAEIVHMVGKLGKVKDATAFERAVLQRENIVSTGVGMGVAIPHAKMTSCEDFFIAIGIQKGKGLDWKALDEAPVKLIFLIGGPPDRQTEYLKILSRLTTAIKDAEFRKQLLSAEAPETVMTHLIDRTQGL